MRRVISRETIEKLYTEEEISRMMHLSAQFHVKPQAQWLFCVFVFAVSRDSPNALRLTVLSTTVSRIHKYTIGPVVLQVAPEITLDDDRDLCVDVLKAHFRAEDRLVYQKLNRREISMYTRSFMDNGAGDDEERLQFLVRDIDDRPEDTKPKLFLVQ
jgi:hypothetical protein